MLSGQSFEADDHFDRLHDSLLCLIFNKIQDAKTLGRCLAVCKRFSSLVRQVDSLVVKVDCVDDSVDADDRNSSESHGSSLSIGLAKFLLYRIISKSFRFLQRTLLFNQKKSISDGSPFHYSPVQVLKRFNEIRALRIQLPDDSGGYGGGGDGLLLKWRAEFGSSLQSCVFLGATSFQKTKLTCIEKGDRNDCSMSSASVGGEETSHGSHGSFCTNGKLKLRIVWTITCLIAASARHHLLQQIIADHPTLRSVVITDSCGQGTLCMGEEQIAESRQCLDSSRTSAALPGRTRVPAVNVKLWYVPRLELPGSGYVMEGATLMAIRPVDRPPEKEESEVSLMAGAFEGEEQGKTFGEAVRAMAKRKARILEMDSF
ncbi:PREDICTED: F-box protein At4g18380-like [Nelumbo nucifera]|uniref:F-box protein At4g18380-like n=1 Tax=Nelumbo nucifera TaxID=4432 RepID=A0A1U8BL05_NELNU|nr:PREDICTED: F-box protein At4g18380-like [Nelumbo nucifera]